MPGSSNNPNERIDPPPTSDEEALREYGRQLAMDSLIEQALLEREAENRPGNVVPLVPRRWGPRAWIPAAAAALVAVLGLSLWKSGNPPPPTPSAPPLAKLDPRWELLAASGADYRILDPNHVELRVGELRFTSLQPAALVVDTPNATSTAQGTDFLIGHHLEETQPHAASVDLVTSQPFSENPRLPAHKHNSNPQNPMKNPSSITRLLVLTGSVVLATDQGSLAASPNEAIVAKAGETPQKLLLEANASFAFDMYAQLAQEKAGQNLFFSPFSMSNALLMATEGARGQTAREMGTVLGFPESLRRNGEEGQSIPWEMGKLRVGQSELNRLIHTGDTIAPEQAKLRAEEATLAASLQELEKKIEVIEKEGIPLDKRDEFYRLSAEKRPVAVKLDDVRARIDTIKLRIANAIWGDQSSSFNEDWKATVTGTYGAGAVRMADFIRNAEKERIRINDWTQAQTGGLIKDLFPEGTLDSDTRLVIVNAIYFKGDWQTTFKKSDTSRQKFTLGSGEAVETALMKKSEDPKASYAAFHGDGRFFATPAMAKESETKGEGAAKLYPGKDGFAMVEMPYRGDKLSMVVIAPNNPAGLPSIEARLNAANLGQWIKSLKPRKTNVYLPKFKMEASYPKLGDTDGTLAAMGMPTAFDETRADFSGMCSTEKLFLGTVVHKALIDVNEEGTEAAAATGVEAMAVSDDPIVSFKPTFRADRPFIFLIRDRESGAVLFLGRMLNPAGLAN